jgi:hypothetical protein
VAPGIVMSWYFIELLPELITKMFIMRWLKNIYCKIKLIAAPVSP